MRLQELLGPFLQKFLVLIWSIFTHNTVLVSAQVTTEPIVFLHRSSRAELKCEFDFIGQLSTVIWKKGPIYEEAEDVVKYFLGIKAGPKNGHGYSLGDDNSTLIIDQVKDEDAGVWWCNVITTDPWTDRSTSNVTVIVEPQDPFPMINHCTTAHCEVNIEDADSEYSITCSALNSRPQVTLTLFLDGKRVQVDPQMRVNDDMTFDTILDVMVPLDDSRTSFVVICEAEGNSFMEDKRVQTLSILRRSAGDTPGLSAASRAGIIVGVIGVLVIVTVFVIVCVISRSVQHRKRGL